MSRNASVQSLGLQWLPGGVEDAPARIWSDFRHVDKKPDTWCVAIVLHCPPGASFSTLISRLHAKFIWKGGCILCVRAESTTWG